MTKLEVFKKKLELLSLRISIGSFYNYNTGLDNNVLYEIVKPYNEKEKNLVKSLKRR